MSNASDMIDRLTEERDAARQKLRDMVPLLQETAATIDHVTNCLMAIVDVCVIEEPSNLVLDKIKFFAEQGLKPAGRRNGK